MDKRAHEYLQKIVLNYKNINMLLSEIRKYFYKSYESRRGYVISTTLGHLYNIDYTLYRMAWELNNFIGEQESKKTEAKVFISQDIAFQAFIRAAESQISKSYEEMLDKYAYAIRGLKAENQNLNKANSSLQTENAALKELLKEDEKKLTARQDSFSNILEKYRNEIIRLKNDGYRLEAEKKAWESKSKSLEEDKRQLESKLQDLTRLQDSRFRQENAILPEKLRELQDKNDRLAQKRNQETAISKGADLPEQAPFQDIGSRKDSAILQTPKSTQYGETITGNLKEEEGLEESSLNSGKPTALRPLQSEIVENETVKLIKNFFLPKVPPPLSGSKAEMIKRIGQASHVEGIVEFLRASSNPSASSYIHQLEKCSSKLEKMQKKAIRMEEEESLSEELSLDFFKIIGETVLSGFMDGIYRGYQRDPDFYERLLKLVNNWIGSCGIYNRMVWPGRKASDKDFEDMTFITKETANPAQHSIMERVERLPYYIDYLEEDGKQASYHQDGVAITLKYANKQKQG